MKILWLFLLALSLYAREIAFTLSHLDDYTKKLSLKQKITIELLAAKLHGDQEDIAFLSKLIEPIKTKKPLGNILLAPSHKPAIIVGKNEQKIKLIQDNHEIGSFNCITGKKSGDKFSEGDQKTPNGIYFPVSFIPPQKLDTIYGHGAFPLNYPNIIDKSFFQKSGHGIWLHATNDDHRPPFSSNGCVVVINPIFDKIKKQIVLKETPVVIVDSFNYLPPKEFMQTRASLGYFVYRWKKLWENSPKNITPYLNLYSSHLISPYGDKKAFMHHKKQVNKKKKWIDLDIKNLYLARDGRLLGFGHLYVASFDLVYRSNNYHWSGKKILYIIKDNDQWKILAEENL